MTLRVQRPYAQGRSDLELSLLSVKDRAQPTQHRPLGAP
jgi:hypothetical protein